MDAIRKQASKFREQVAKQQQVIFCFFMQAYIEKEDSKKLKQKQRKRMQPKMGKMDIAYQVLHDAFIKYQTKLTSLGELYHEGKEKNLRIKDCDCFVVWTKGLRWYAKRLRIDEDGVVADEFLERFLQRRQHSM